jgi:methyltransferase family protein
VAFRLASLSESKPSAEAEFDPYLHDPSRWGVSLAQMTELLIPCLRAARVRSIAEVGAFAGDLTRILVAWAAQDGARVLAIDPSPQDALVALAEEHPELELVRQTSLQALPAMPLPDAIVIDGDHNYHTVSEELRLIGERRGDGPWPLLLFHDVCWPHARRDDYFDPQQIPPQARHPLVGEGAGIIPGDPGSRPGGLPYPKSAATEGGPGNGVLTAVEDFVAEHTELRFALVPAFFGFGAVWDRGADFAPALQALLAPFDRHPILERLEANRVEQLANSHQHLAELWRAQAELTRQREVLQRLLDSSAFAVAERLSRLRAASGIASEQSIVSKDEIRRALSEH